MKIGEVSFTKSLASYQQVPRPVLPSFAMIGRSNVGKSSLVNGLLGRKKIAKVSSKPGKTQLINYFLVNKAWYLVDLPGYGWAEVSKKKKVAWEKMVRSYLLHGEGLVNVFLLIDGRHPPQKKDLDFIHWLGENQIPCAVVVTKSDLVKKEVLRKNIQAFQQAMALRWEALPPFFITSSKKKEGFKSLLLYVKAWMEEEGK